MKRGYTSNQLEGEEEQGGGEGEREKGEQGGGKGGGREGEQGGGEGGGRKEEQGGGEGGGREGEQGGGGDRTVDKESSNVTESQNLKIT